MTRYAMPAALLAVAALAAEPNAERQAILKAMKANYPKHLDDLKAQLKRAEAGRVSPVATRKTFVPPNKSEPIVYPSQRAKDEFVGKIKDALDAVREDPTLAAPVIQPPIGTSTFGRFGPMYADRILPGGDVLAMFLDRNMQPIMDRPVIVSGNTSKIIDKQVVQIGGVFAVSDARAVEFEVHIPDGRGKFTKRNIIARCYRFQPVEFSEEEKREIASGKQ